MFIAVTKKYISDLYIFSKSLIWKKIKKRQGISNLKVFPDISLKFKNYGDIVGIAFQREHLVGRKKGFEYETFIQIFENLKADSTMLDIGANIGIFSLAVDKKFNGTVNIHCFEPSLRTYNALEENINLNKSSKIKAYRMALAEKEGEVSMGGEDDKKGLYKDGDAFNHIQYGKKTNLVKCSTLDIFTKTQNLKAIDLIKIDIEGAELLALKGAKQSIRKYKPVIIFEAYEPFCQRYNYTIMDILLLLHELDYSIIQYEFAQWIAKPKK